MILLLILTCLTGGNGSDFFDFIAELVATILLFIVLASPNVSGYRNGLALKGLLLLICAVPLAQLAPLPISIWRTLPGHDVAYEIQAQAVALGGYHAVSLDPAMTRLTALRLLPAIAIFLSALRADARERRLLGLIAVSLIILSALIGVIQFSTGALYLYPTPHEGSSVGIFVNRNHEADSLLVGMLLIAGLGRERTLPAAALALFTALIMFLALCVVTTSSRMGTALMPFTAFASLTLLLGRRNQWRYWFAGLAAALVAASALLLLDNSVIEHTMGRFAGSDEDSRYGFWTDAMVAIRRYWPVGAGIGTFIPIYATVENLDNVTSAYVNHAHNEYLELALEAGLAGLILIAGYVAILLASVRRILGSTDWPMRTAGLCIILVLLAHSAVDYPLRTLSLSALFGLANAMLVGCGGKSRLRLSAPHKLPASVDLGA